MTSTINGTQKQQEIYNQPQIVFTHIQDER